MLNEREAESCYLGQFIPLQYHHNMLMDANRMDNFKAAIQRQVFDGAKVLELGGGTGVLSWFAAQSAAKVYCVEFNPDMVAEARRLLAKNRDGDKVEVIHADAFEYLPPEPVDVVICEMIHVAMLREKQVEVIENFKQRYLEKFGGPLPIFIPEAVVMAVQPVQQTCDFLGYQAPIIQFLQPGVFSADTRELAQPALYSVIDFTQTNGLQISWAGSFTIEQGGSVTALRFITKNILAVLMETGGTIDWLNHYLSLPLDEAVEVKAGDILELSFSYRAGGSFASLQNSIKVQVKSAALRSQHLSLVVS
ncbi:MULTISPECIES: methyltransferase domain-containing protein [unclassified Undibacterium]|uniref:methyltransferase domain-containing protein n=1 Tax=unclassified Undibacterium TaxID=2630295 RepID=UPI002AC97083|nr:MULTISPECIES: methyltransferase domain-containing protein [unclassified Undibacterium]MEB0137720.1 methyltransferase domain-containing protein [Undibacterium sp. CCC2.1]MEB0172838.1 methyltransferase domain-containing protein [Undibacterium sp. CCC1.1]MEB0176688.1 methyltransferase domain-containing protein [Undibacterium sp. CCC3.4]MEB0215986.1 methyltransferase domain-containing protein [Undibacterium sp. 5I2]WPX42295.1 methyltransferase domain-containing protein [Undibacterium sp. CCC3.4